MEKWASRDYYAAMDSQQPPTSAPVPPPSATPTLVPTITYDDFAKLALRVATIVEAQSIEKSKKLVRLQIDLGDERRQILAGIKEHYTPEQLVGRQIVVIANLAPREVIKGEVSNGMLLAAHDAATGRVILVAPSDTVSPGSKVS
jgi:methionyl-tRNA synthetase